jgi:hypothetical protein
LVCNRRVVQLHPVPEWVLLPFAGRSPTDLSLRNVRRQRQLQLYHVSCWQLLCYPGWPAEPLRSRIVLDLWRHQLHVMPGGLLLPNDLGNHPVPLPGRLVRDWRQPVVHSVSCGRCLPFHYFCGSHHGMYHWHVLPGRVHGVRSLPGWVGLSKRQRCRHHPMCPGNVLEWRHVVFTVHGLPCWGGLPSH